MKKRSKKFMFAIPLALIAGGLIAASSVSNYLLFGVETEPQNVFYNNRISNDPNSSGYDPSNPGSPTSGSGWITASYDKYDAIARQTLSSPLQRLDTTNGWSRVALPAMSMRTDGRNNIDWLASQGYGGLRTGHHFSTGYSSSIKGKNAEGGTKTGGTMLYSQYTNHSPVASGYKNFNLWNTKVGGFDSSKLNADSANGEAFYFLRGFKVDNTAKKISWTSTDSLSYNEGSGDKGTIGPNSSLRRFYLNIPSNRFTDLYLNQSLSSNVNQNLYLGRNGADRYLGLLQINYSYTSLSNSDYYTQSRQSFALKVETNNKKNFFVNNRRGGADNNYEGYQDSTLTDSNGYRSPFFMRYYGRMEKQTWKPWWSIVGTTNVFIQVLYAFDNPYTNNISLYLQDASGQSPYFFDNSYSVSTIQNDKKSYYYPSQIMNSKNTGSLIGEFLSVNYSEWNPRFYLSNVQYKVNDDLGELYLKITPGPNINYNLKPRERWITSLSPSNEINITITGFKANNTSWKTSTITFRNGADVIATVDNISINMLKQEIWDQLTSSASNEGSYWYSKDDMILENWDRIPGFSREDIIIEPLKSNNVNLKEGTITVQVALKKAIINGQVKTSSSGLIPKTITFNGFYKVTERSSINRSWISIGNNSSLSFLETASKSDGKIWIKQKIIDHEVQNQLTDNSIFKNIDANLLRGSSSATQNFEVLDYIVNTTTGSIDVMYRLNKIYDPNINVHEAINGSIVGKVTLAGYVGKDSDVISTNQTTRLMVDNKLIGQTSSSINGLKGIGSSVKNISTPSYPVVGGISGNSISNIQSIYYDRIKNNYIGLYHSTSNGDLLVNTSPTPSFNNADQDRYGLNFNFNGDTQYSLPKSLYEDMRLVPITNVTGNVSSYLAFPAGVTGEVNNNYVYYINFSDRFPVIKKISNLPNIGSGQYIVSAGAYDYNYSSTNRSYGLRLDYVIADASTSRLTYNSVYTTSSTYDQYEYRYDHNITQPVNTTMSTWEKQLYNFNFNNSSNLNNVIIDNAFSNNVMPINIPIYLKPNGEYVTSWTRVSSNDGTIEVQKYSSSSDVTANNSGVNVDIIPIASAVEPTASDYASMFKVKDLKNIYSSLNNEILIINISGKDTPTVDGNFKNQDIATIINLNDHSKNYDLVLGSYADKDLFVIPDSSTQYNNYSIGLNQEGIISSAERIQTTFNTEYIADTSIVEIYEKYLSSNASQNYLDFSNYIIDNFIYNPTNGLNNVINLPLYMQTNQNIRSSIHVPYDQVSFNFNENEVTFVLTLDKTVQANLNLTKDSFLVTLKTNDTSIQKVTSVTPKTTWQEVSSDSESLENKINEINNSGDFASYLEIINPLNDTTNFVAGSLNLVSLDRSNSKATLAITINKAMDNINGSLIPIENKVIQFEVNLKQSLPTMVQTVDASTQLNDYKNYFPSDIVNNLNNNDPTIISAFKEALINQLKLNNASLGFSEEAYPTIDDIIFNGTWNFNNSTGQLWVNVSIPSYAGSDDVSNNPYVNTKVIFANFKSQAATTVSAIDYANVNSGYVPPSFKPSELQSYFDSKWYNIYQFVTINNPYGESTPAWLPHIINPNYSPTNGEPMYLSNTSYDTSILDNMSSSDISSMLNNNTSLSAQVLTFDDSTGTAEVKVYIKNFYSSEDNSFLQSGNSPFPEDVTEQIITITGLYTDSDSIKTSVNDTTYTNFSSTDSQANLIPSQLIISDQKWLADQILANAVENGVSGATITFKELVPNNKQGTINVSFTMNQVQGTNGPVDGSTVLFKTKIIGLRKITAPTSVTINSAPISFDVSSLSSKLFGEDGKLKMSGTSVDQDALNLLKSLVTIKNVPYGWEKEVSNGQVVNVNLETNTATVKFSLKQYFADDETYSMLEDYEISFDVTSTSTATYTSNLVVKYKDSNNNTIVLKSDTISIKNKNNTSALLWLSISSTLSLSILLVASILYIAWFRRWKAK